MPGRLRAFVDVDPVTRLVTAIRGLMHGGVTAARIGWVLMASAVMVALLAPVTMYPYRKRNRPAPRTAIVR